MRNYRRPRKVHCRTYHIHQAFLPNIIYHVFISKLATQNLADYIKKENWGRNNILLYKYLDYIWRLQLVDKQVKMFRFFNEARLVFNTGLNRRSDNEPLYFCLIPNSDQWEQKWRLPCDKTLNRNKSFVTKEDLIKIYKFRKHDIPLQTNFNRKKKNSEFNPGYSFVMNIPERIRTTQARIMESLQNDINYKDWVTQYELQELIEMSLATSLKMARTNPAIVSEQVFIERRLVGDAKLTIGYHLELLLPLTLNIQGKNVYMSLVLRANHLLKQYEGMSIITREMAYCNSRLSGPITVPWLKYFVNTNRLDSNTEQKMLTECEATYNIGNYSRGKNMDIISNYIEFPNDLLILKTNNSNSNNIDDDYYKNDSINDQYNPFFYLATMLPLRLPKLTQQSPKKIPTIIQNNTQSVSPSISSDICRLQPMNSMNSMISNNMSPLLLGYSNLSNSSNSSNLSNVSNSSNSLNSMQSCSDLCNSVISHDNNSNNGGESDSILCNKNIKLRVQIDIY